VVSLTGAWIIAAVSRLAVALVLVVALASTVSTLPGTWRDLSRQREAYAGLSAQGREHAFGDAMPLPMQVFDFYRARLRPGDRYYLQVQQTGFGRFLDLPAAVSSVARFYLLPAIYERNLDDANVVLSFGADPSLLHLRFRSQERAGKQSIFVSRLFR